MKVMTKAELMAQNVRLREQIATYNAVINEIIGDACVHEDSSAWFIAGERLLDLAASYVTEEDIAAVEARYPDTACSEEFQAGVARLRVSLSEKLAASGYDFAAHKPEPEAQG